VGPGPDDPTDPTDPTDPDVTEDPDDVPASPRSAQAGVPQTLGAGPGELPFTGLPAGIMGLVGALMALGGGTMRRRLR
jgi:hypothetical protein